MNAFMHKTETREWHAVETVGQLRDALVDMGADTDMELDKTYVVALMAETLSDGSTALSIQIRAAEQI